MMKFFQKPNGTVFKIQFAAFVWILFCTAIVQIIEHTVPGGCPIPGWTIFLANVTFFIKGNPNHKEGLLEDGLGGLFGLLGTFATIHIMIALEKAGLAPLIALLIPIAVFLFLTIALHPFVPYVFNNYALCFFTIGFVPEIANLVEGSISEVPFLYFGSNLLKCMGGVVIGNLIVNMGIIIIVALITKAAVKKAANK